mmetsp:Transcript_2894/g.6932  ORF Transcript_2894/g.6932 Transcript_2894/m.6932 type:complete len:217 (+) Transcript_2894:211-861(+)
MCLTGPRRRARRRDHALLRIGRCGGGPGEFGGRCGRASWLDDHAPHGPVGAVVVGGSRGSGCGGQGELCEEAQVRCQPGPDRVWRFSGPAGQERREHHGPDPRVVCHHPGAGLFYGRRLPSGSGRKRKVLGSFRLGDHSRWIRLLLVLSSLIFPRARCAEEEAGGRHEDHAGFRTGLVSWGHGWISLCDARPAGRRQRGRLRHDQRTRPRRESQNK